MLLGVPGSTRRWRLKRFFGVREGVWELLGLGNTQGLLSVGFWGMGVVCMGLVGGEWHVCV